MAAPQPFDPARYAPELGRILRDLAALPSLDARRVDAVLRRTPKDGRGFFSRSELIAGLRHYGPGWGLDTERLVEGLRRKPVRTASGVTPVTVFTKPFPCPGRCVFCPNDPTMPKSYVASEPGCQRAAEHAFDPYRQTWSRVDAFRSTGHPVDKIELIVLGGTWSHYPEAYQVWFVKRCFDALNDLGAGRDARARPNEAGGFEALRLRRDGGLAGAYDRTVAAHLRASSGGTLADSREAAGFAELEASHAANETAAVRCVGLVLETRPDRVDAAEVRRLRRLGATKIQLGYQSADDAVLARNRRGHDVDASRRATRLLRGAGFKIQAHWMPNLLGATPEGDVADYARLHEDPDLCPDELKIYPCSLLADTELAEHHARGAWRPYGDEELTAVLVACLEHTPPWCRLSRVVRDIPSQEILVGNRRTNFRELAERALDGRGGRRRDIRSREVRAGEVDPEGLRLRAHEYAIGTGREVFLEWVDARERIAGFLRLGLPAVSGPLPELEGSALVREVHVYGPSLELGRRAPARAQHAGLGRALVEEAARRAREAGFGDLAVISAVGTRDWYRRLGFRDGELYQHRSLAQAATP